MTSPFNKPWAEQVKEEQEFFLGKDTRSDEFAESIIKDVKTPKHDEQEAPDTAPHQKQVRND